MLDNFKDMSKNMIKAKEGDRREFITMISYILPEYEKNFIKEYAGGRWIKL